MTSIKTTKKNVQICKYFVYSLRIWIIDILNFKILTILAFISWTPLAYTAPVVSAIGENNQLTPGIAVPVVAKISAPVPTTYTDPVFKATVPLPYSLPVVAPAPIDNEASPSAFTFSDVFSSPFLSPLTFHQFWSIMLTES